LIINFEGDSIKIEDITDDHFVFFVTNDNCIYQIIKIDFGYRVAKIPSDLNNIKKAIHDTIGGAIIHMNRRGIAKGIFGNAYVFKGEEKAKRFLSVQLNRAVK
jgi:hypothetical protein